MARKKNDHSNEEGVGGKKAEALGRREPKATTF